ncbi:hypothetical protein FA13DRAFT_9114 [Coprinellus micaceus]|uniref:Uncharacterized protein n=1 Tax=Coprinellus micaceus TaxID=71717 RepID=A0A4Y7TZX4_COPMI|nr:hypothetical protein FA13DRAFT_9114 [Coprinellus micaceus]
MTSRYMVGSFLSGRPQLAAHTGPRVTPSPSFRSDSSPQPSPTCILFHFVPVLGPNWPNTVHWSARDNRLATLRLSSTPAQSLIHRSIGNSSGNSFVFALVAD